MSDTPPVSFENLARTAANPAAGGYPYQIRGADLDKNFVFATLKIAKSSPNGSPQPFSITEVTGTGGHPQRSLAFHPSPPIGGDKLLFSFNNGDYAWSSPAIPDGDSPGQMLYWNTDAEAWQLITPEAAGQMLYWNATDKAWQMITPSAAGQMLYWNADAKAWQLITPEAAGQMLYWNADAKAWQLITPGAAGQMLYWNATDKVWQLITPEAAGQMLYWNADAKAWQLITPPTSGTHVLGAVDGALQWIATEQC